MAFQVDCPNCGRRPVWEFHYGGPQKKRPPADATPEEWTDYIYNKPNVRGVQREWWYHRSACKAWFLADRDTRTNTVLSTWIYRPESPVGRRDHEHSREVEEVAGGDG